MGVGGWKDIAVLGGRAGFHLSLSLSLALCLEPRVTCSPCLVDNTSFCSVLSHVGFQQCRQEERERKRKKRSNLGRARYSTVLTVRFFIVLARRSRVMNIHRFIKTKLESAHSEDTVCIRWSRESGSVAGVQFQSWASRSHALPQFNPPSLPRTAVTPPTLAVSDFRV